VYRWSQLTLTRRDVLSVYETHDILQYSLDHSEATASELSISTGDGGRILVTLPRGLSRVD